MTKYSQIKYNIRQNIIISGKWLRLTYGFIAPTAPLDDDKFNKFNKELQRVLISLFSEESSVAKESSWDIDFDTNYEDGYDSITFTNKEDEDDTYTFELTLETINGNSNNIYHIINLQPVEVKAEIGSPEFETEKNTAIKKIINFVVQIQIAIEITNKRILRGPGIEGRKEAVLAHTGPQGGGRRVTRRKKRTHRTKRRKHTHHKRRN